MFVNKGELLKPKGSFWRPYCFSSFRGERSCSSSSNLNSLMVCYLNITAKTMEITINNVVLMHDFSDQRKTQQREGRSVTVQSVAAPSIVQVHSLTVFFFFLRALRLAKTS